MHELRNVDDMMTRAMALNVAAWTESSVRCLDVQTFRSRCLWWRQPGGSPIYLAASIFDAEVDDEELHSDLRQVREAWGSEQFFVWDCWARRDLGKVGLQREWTSTWYLRPPSGQAGEFGMPPGLSIEIVASADQLADFEQATWEGFEMAEAEHLASERFSQHALTTLDDPGMVYLNARLDGRVVASTITHASDGIVGIYGISTLPAFRRRGYATALVRAAVALRPELPTCVQPDPPSIPIYTGMGFVPAGEITSWKVGPLVP